jgi:hypothetical protein
LPCKIRFEAPKRQRGGREREREREGDSKDVAKLNSDKVAVEEEAYSE